MIRSNLVRVAALCSVCLAGSAAYAAPPQLQNSVEGGAPSSMDGVRPAATTPTTPTKLLYRFNLAPGQDSESIKVPVVNTPVLVMGVQTALGTRGVGQVTMLRVKDTFLEWTGVESPANAAITSGFSSSDGTHIVWIDFVQSVDLQVKDGNSFKVHNASGSQQTGTVTLIY